MRFSSQIVGYIYKKNVLPGVQRLKEERLSRLFTAALYPHRAHRNEAAFWKKPSARRGNIVSQVPPFKRCPPLKAERTAVSPGVRGRGGGEGRGKLRSGCERKRRLPLQTSERQARLSAQRGECSCPAGRKVAVSARSIPLC